jgi:hypothetical protein
VLTDDAFAVLNDAQVSRYPSTHMTTIDPTGSPVSPTDAEAVAAGAFMPDLGTIERLANAFLQELTGGAPAAPPAVPASPPALGRRPRSRGRQ